MLNFDSLLIFSENPKKLTGFYQKILSAKTDWEGGDFCGFKVGSCMLIIGPHDKVKGKNQNPERIMLNLSTDHFEKEYERITKAGVKVIAKPYHPGEDLTMTLATFADPDGNFFQLGTQMK